MITSQEQEQAPGELEAPEGARQRRKKWLVFAAAFGPVTLIAFLLIWGTVRSGGRPGGVLVQDVGGLAEIAPRPAPDFTLITFEGESVTLSDLRGQVVFVDFWASWCPPCRSEAPTLKYVSDQYADRDVTFIGIDVWDMPGQGRSFARDWDWEYPTGIDPNGVITIEYGVKGLPEKFFVDRDGNLVKKFVGPITVPELTGILEELLADEAAG